MVSQRVPKSHCENVNPLSLLKFLLLILNTSRRRSELINILMVIKPIKYLFF